MQRELFSRDFTCNTLIVPMNLRSLSDPTGLGIDDIKQSENTDEQGEPYVYFEIFTDKQNLREVQKKIEQLGYHIDSFELVKISKDLIVASDGEREKVETLIEALEEYDDVGEIWTNLE